MPGRLPDARIVRSVTGVGTRLNVATTGSRMAIRFAACGNEDGPERTKHADGEMNRPSERPSADPVQLFTSFP